MAERVATVATVVIVINVLDIEREKQFWSALLGSEVTREVPGFFA